MWTTLVFDFTVSELKNNPKSMFANITNRTLYVRVTDSKGNISTLYQIDGVTVQ